LSLGGPAVGVLAPSRRFLRRMRKYFRRLDQGNRRSFSYISIGIGMGARLPGPAAIQLPLPGQIGKALGGTGCWRVLIMALILGKTTPHRRYELGPFRFSANLVIRNLGLNAISSRQVGMASGPKFAATVSPRPGFVMAGAWGRGRCGFAPRGADPESWGLFVFRMPYDEGGGAVVAGPACGNPAISPPTRTSSHRTDRAGHRFMP